METLQTSRIIKAIPEDVFAAFTNEDRLAKWWGPEGFSCTFEVCDLRPGGKWTFTMHGPDGKDYPNESEFGEIDPPNKFVVKHVCEPVFTATFTLEAVEEGTLLVWTSEFENENFVKNARSFLETANEQNLDKLVREVLG